MTDVKRYGKQMKALANEGRWAKVLQMLDTLVVEDVKVNVILCNIAISSLQANWRNAVYVLKRDMDRKSVLPDVVSLNSLVNVCEKTTAWRSATWLATSLLDVRVAMDVIGFSGLMSSLSGSTSMWMRGVHILNQLYKEVTIDVIAVSSAITCCEKDQQWQHGVSLLFNMASNRNAPNVVSYNSSISACEKAGQWETATNLLGALQGERIADIVSYNSTISACEKGNCWVYALGLLLSMELALLTPDIVSYSSVISAAEKGGQWIMALLLLHDIDDHDLRPDVVVYSSAISACEKGRQWEIALALLAQMDHLRIYPNVISFNSVLSACEKAGQVKVAFALFLQLLHTETLQVDVITFSAILTSLGTATRTPWRRALELVKLMKDEEISTNLLAFNGALSCMKTAWKQTLQLLARMELQEKVPDMISWNFCVNTCEMSQQWLNTLQLLKDIDQAQLAFAAAGRK